MTRIITIITLMATLCMPAAIAQDNKCDEIIGRVTNSLTKGGGVSVKFTSSTTAGNRMVQEMSGSIKIKGKKFILYSSMMEMGFDGKTAWSHVKGSNEINLSEPTEEELVTINPYILLNNYKKTYKAEYLGMKNGNEIIKFVPVSSNADMKSATVSVNHERSFPSRLEIINRDASKTVINIESCVSSAGNDDSIFIFSEENYPNNEIIDLR